MQFLSPERFETICAVCKNLQTSPP